MNPQPSIPHSALRAPHLDGFAGPPALLLQHFESLADTPDAVPKLRALILDLAIRGALVPQNPDDPPARKVVEQARAQMNEKREAQRTSNGKAPTLAPFSLPANWCWASLDDLGDTAPRNELPDKTEVGFSPMRLVTAQFGEPITFEHRPWADVRKGFTHFADGDVVVAKITPCFENGKSGVIRSAPNGYGAGTTELHVFRPVRDCVIPEYALVFLKSPHFLLNGKNHMTGSAGQKRVPWDYFARTRFPLPPLPEQRRIVAKVEDLLALCDQLETRQAAAREHRTRLVRSALDHLTAAKDEQDFRKQASFILHNSSLILDSVPALRRAIPSLAVQGRVCSSGDSGWQRVRVHQLTSLVTSGSRGWAEFYADNGPLFIRAQNVRRNGTLLLDDVAHVQLPSKTEGARTRVHKDDLLVVITGAGVAQAARVENDLGESYVSQHVALIRLKNPAFAPWLNLELHAAAGCLGQLQELTYGAKPGLNLTNIRDLVLSLPSLADQKRILAKVEELMRWCDRLETELATVRTAGAHLLDATLNQLLNGACGPTDPPKAKGTVK